MKKPSAAAKKKKPNNDEEEQQHEEQQQQLIEEHLFAAAPKNTQNDDDSTSTGSRETSSESEEDNKKPKATSPRTPQTPVPPHMKASSVPTRSSPRIVAKMKETAKLFPRQTNLELPTNRTATVAFPDGAEEKVVVMSRAHSMFMNCVPVTKDQLGADVLEKIQSIVRNSLFKSAKFYPLPNHADAVVGLCLYDCDYRRPGIKGDFGRAKVWDAVRNEIILQTGIIRQQIVP